MFFLRQSTASQEIPLGPFVDAADGSTAETGLTIANTDIKLWKTGATTLADKNSGGATHISSGIYYAVLDATDTNTLGPTKIFVSVAGARPVTLEVCVLDAAVYDSLIAATDKLGVDAQEISGDSAAADNLERWFDGTVGFSTSESRLSLSTSSLGAALSVITDSSTDPAVIISQDSGVGTADAMFIFSGVGNGVRVESAANYDCFKLNPGTGGFGISGTVEGNITGALSGSVGSVTGAVGSVTATVNANAIQISGDSAAADNLERWFDGTVGFATSGGALTLSNASGPGLSITGTTYGLYATASAGIGIYGTGSTYGIQGNGATAGLKASGSSAGFELTSGTASVMTLTGSGGNRLVCDFYGNLTGNVVGNVTGTVGGGAGSNAVTVNVKDGAAANVAGATVSLTEGVTLMTATTNASGNASFSLSNATYTCSITKSGYSFTPDTITVSGAATFNKVITAVTAPTPSGPTLCVVTGSFVDIANADDELTIKFTLRAPRNATAGGVLVSTTEYEATTTAGALSLELIRTDAFDQPNVYYEVTCVALGWRRKRLYLAAASKDLSTI